MINCEFRCILNTTFNVFGVHFSCCQYMQINRIWHGHWKKWVTMETAKQIYFEAWANQQHPEQGSSHQYSYSYTLYGPDAKLALVFPGAVTRSCLLLPRPALKMSDTSSWFFTPLGIASPKPFLVTTRFSLGGAQGKNKTKSVYFKTHHKELTAFSADWLFVAP